jgi:predicted transcriptional regulator
MSDCLAFTTQLDPELLRTVNNLAQSEGRGMQSLIEEALTNLVTARTQRRFVARNPPPLHSFAPLYGLLND